MSSHHLLKSLSAAALALPAIATQATTVADSTEVSYRYNKYQEQEMEAADVHKGSVERYEVDVNQFSLKVPLSDRVQARVNLQVEQMSGASPWYTQKVDGEVKQVMSGASIKEERKDVAAQLSYFGDNLSVSGNIAHSSENDYESISGGAELSYSFSDKMTTLAFSADVTQDEITPSDALAFGRTEFEEKESASGHLALSRILTKNLMVQLGWGIFNRTGYLSDPYKVVIVDNAAIDDARPDSRLAATYTGRLRYYVEGINTAIHFDYRLYDDNWNVVSHTIDFAPYINVGAGWQLVPSVRLYSQTKAFFYQNYYETARADGYYSTDSRLSTFGAYTLGLKINKQLGNWFLTASYQHYTSSHDLALKEATEQSSSLVNFDVVSIGLDYKF